MYVGVEPEAQTSRELKDKYGVFAYLVNATRHVGDATPNAHYRVELDGESLDFDASRVYVVNSGMMGSGLRITHSYAIDDGLLDCFLIDKNSYATIATAVVRFLDLPTAKATRAAPRWRTTSAACSTASASTARPRSTSPPVCLTTPRTDCAGRGCNFLATDAERSDSAS